MVKFSFKLLGLCTLLVANTAKPLHSLSLPSGENPLPGGHGSGWKVVGDMAMFRQLSTAYESPHRASESPRTANETRGGILCWLAGTNRVLGAVHSSVGVQPNFDSFRGRHRYRHVDWE